MKPTVGLEFFSDNVLIHAGERVANSVAITKTAAFTATPTHTVPLRPSLGRRINAATSVPITAPPVLVA